MRNDPARATSGTRTHVVILGGGFAGLAAARAFESRGRADVDVTLVNLENFLLFTPMLPEVAGGSLDMRAIVHPLRVSLKRTTFILGEVHTVDAAARVVHLRHPVLKTEATVAFDHLVFALGAETSTFGLPGVAEHTYPLKSLPDAGRIRARIVGVFEAAAATHDLVQRDRLLRFVVVGGGFTGVECAGELAAFVRRLRTVYTTLRDVVPEIVLVDGERRLLGHLPEAFGKHAARSLRERGVRLALTERVASADREGLTLASGTRYESATVIWTAGVEPAPLLKKTGLQTNKHGALVVNPDLSVPGFAGFWGIGDCAAVPTRGGGTATPLAQNAVEEGPLLARNILAAIRGKATRPFTYRLRGMAASLGNRDAVVQLPGNRFVTGFPAWVMWRAYYLSQLPGTGRKVQVAADWTITGLFAQSVARLPWISDRSTIEEDHAAEG